MNKFISISVEIGLSVAFATIAILIAVYGNIMMAILTALIVLGPLKQYLAPVIKKWVTK